MLSFFNQDSTLEAVQDIASSDYVTVFAGAGTSVEAGLPLWGRLVDDLLADALRATQPEVGEEELLCRARSLDVLARAELAEALYAVNPAHNLPSLGEAVEGHLYDGTDPAEFGPGLLAIEIARLQQELGDAMRIATTNYDDVIESALRSVGYPRTRLRSYISNQSPAAGIAAVYHLHGLLATERKGAIILTEGDYHRMQRRTSWQERFSLGALKASTCIFLGASMTDPNVLRYLHSAPQGDRRHYAFFVRPSDCGPHPSAEQLAWEASLRHRWERLGVVALFPDNYGDLAQFVREVRLAATQGAEYAPVPDRLAGWLERTREHVRTEDPAVYREVQVALNTMLRDLLEGIRHGLLEAGVDTFDEQLQLGVFTTYEPEFEGASERVQVLATSDRVMVDPSGIQPLELHSASSWTGVVALADGGRRGEEKDTYASRWKYVLAVPYVDTATNLLVGAVALSSTAPAADTCLLRLTTGQMYELDVLLQGVGQEVFD